MRTKYRKDKLKCPRCETVCLQGQKKCDECGLVFARLSEANNTEAKKQFFSKDKSIVMVKDLPKDVNKIKLAFLAGLLGPFGAHNFYVGRYYKAIFSAFFSGIVALYIIISTFISSSPAVVAFFSNPLIVVPTGILTYLWLSDFVMILFDRYKVPVALRREE
ncbi:MAG: TM2 domain-containing protein [Christensenellales bacterium]|jgi:hypothetical protein